MSERIIGKNCIFQIGRTVIDPNADRRPFTHELVYAGANEKGPMFKVLKIKRQTAVE